MSGFLPSKEAGDRQRMDKKIQYTRRGKFPEGEIV
jgi:hypothetical protein